MRVLIVYESMYGNTRTVAERIGAGLGPDLDVDVVPVADATAERVAGADLLVVGGPTHVHGLSWPRTRRAAVEAAAKDPALDALPGADGRGLREWLAHLPSPTTGAAAAAFDTRIDAPAAFTGQPAGPWAAACAGAAGPSGPHPRASSSTRRTGCWPTSRREPRRGGRRWRPASGETAPGRGPDRQVRSPTHATTRSASASRAPSGWRR